MCSWHLWRRDRLSGWCSMRMVVVVVGSCFHQFRTWCPMEHWSINTSYKQHGKASKSRISLISMSLVFLRERKLNVLWRTTSRYDPVSGKWSPQRNSHHTKVYGRRSGTEKKALKRNHHQPSSAIQHHRITPVQQKKKNVKKSSHLHWKIQKHNYGGARIHHVLSLPGLLHWSRPAEYL